MVLAPASTINYSALTRTLDPTIPPFTPLPGPSTERPTRGKAKSKSGVSTTKEDIAQEYSKIEVNTIRARLKLIETKNKDLEFQISLLLERLAVFEKAEKEAIYEKYFPTPDTIPKPPSDRVACPHPQPVSHCPHSQCCYQRQCCQSISRQNQTTPSKAPPTTEILDTIQKSIDQVKSDLSALNDKFHRRDTPAHVQAQPGGESEQYSENIPQSDVNTSPGELSRIEGEDVNGMDDSADSITTVDENTPELSDDESLNSYVPTIQLLKLRP